MRAPAIESARATAPRARGAAAERRAAGSWTWRDRAIAAALVLFVLAEVALVVVSAYAPEVPLR